MRKLTICSFNILSDDYVNLRGKGSAAFMRRYYPTVDKSLMPLSERLPKIIAHMKKIDADVFCLQEVMAKARRALVEAFPDFYVSALARHKLLLDDINKNRTGNLVLVRKTAHHRSSTNATPHVLSDAKSHTRSLQHEGYVYSEVSCLYGTRRIIVLSIHLTDTPAKYQQITELLKVCRRHKTAGATVICAGDFNTSSKRMHQQLTRLGFESVIPRTTTKIERGTYLCERPMIDYIYVLSPESVSLDGSIDNSPITNPGVDGCFETTLKLLGADHYPVRGSIVFGKSSATVNKDNNDKNVKNA
jgi:endonuclease/exonuclease/phosphatase family metal-dependent hydrolase